MNGVTNLLVQLPHRGWGVLRNPDQLSLINAMILGLIKVQRSGPGMHVYEARLTAAGREYVTNYCT